VRRRSPTRGPPPGGFSSLQPSQREFLLSQSRVLRLSVALLVSLQAAGQEGTLVDDSLRLNTPSQYLVRLPGCWECDCAFMQR
jgi:hypothetical protein